MHLRVNLKFFGEILVHPVRRQNFAGTGAPYILQHLRLCPTQPIWRTLALQASNNVPFVSVINPLFIIMEIKN